MENVEDVNKEILNDEAEASEAVEENSERSEDGEREIDLNQLNRDDYTKEQWREIQQLLREAKRERRKTDKKPKKQKEKERKLARRKHGGR